MAVAAEALALQLAAAWTGDFTVGYPRDVGTSDRDQTQPGWMEGVQDWAARLLAISVTVLIIGGLAHLAWTEDVAGFLGVIEANWKASVLLLGALFYRPIRAFLERLESVGNLKATPLRPDQAETFPYPEPSGEPSVGSEQEPGQE